MNPKIICLLAALSLALSGSVLAAGAKTYQITGTVVEATGSKVTVEKGAERFEFDIDPTTTKGSAELKVGSTVTVTYVMSATRIVPSASSTAPAETPPPVPASPNPAP
jgi:type 1 fimbria pilin